MRRNPAAGGQGLAHVSTEKLKRLLKRLHDGTLICPITQMTLVVAGLPDLVDEVGHLQGLDARSSIAVVVAVIAERAQFEKRLAQLQRE